MASGSHRVLPPGAPARDRETPAQARRRLLRGEDGLLSRVLALREGSIIVVTLVVAIYFALNTSSFFTSANFKTLLPYFAPFAILGAGEVFVMILGEIDLSIGGTYLLAPYLFYKLSATVGLPLVPAVIVALIACMAVGLINGFFTAIVGISSFVVTLGMLFALEGLALVISHGEPVRRPAPRSRDHPGHPCGQRRADPPPRTGQPHQHVRENLRRRHLLGADLGARDRDRPAGRARRSRAGACTRSRSARTSSAPARPGCT